MKSTPYNLPSIVEPCSTVVFQVKRVRLQATVSNPSDIDIASHTFLSGGYAIPRCVTLYHTVQLNGCLTSACAWCSRNEHYCIETKTELDRLSRVARRSKVGHGAQQRMFNQFPWPDTCSSWAVQSARSVLWPWLSGVAKLPIFPTILQVRVSVLSARVSAACELFIRMSFWSAPP